MHGAIIQPILYNNYRKKRFEPENPKRFFSRYYVCNLFKYLNLADNGQFFCLALCCIYDTHNAEHKQAQINKR